MDSDCNFENNISGKKKRKRWIEEKLKKKKNGNS